MSQYFPPYRSSGRNIKVELDLSSYATKTDLKNVTHVDVGSFASKTNLASLKTEVYKLDVDKLVPVPNDLAKLSNVVKNDVAKKTEYKISKVDKKISDVNDLVKKTDFNAKITKVESKIRNIT